LRAIKTITAYGSGIGEEKEFEKRQPNTYQKYNRITNAQYSQVNPTFCTVRLSGSLFFSSIWLLWFRYNLITDLFFTKEFL
jgi:hypothetical protein